MRVYVEVARRAYLMSQTYRVANLAGLATNSFWGALRTFLYLGLFAGTASEAGWTAQDAVDYVWITQAIIMPVYFWGWWEIALTIRSGDIVADLSKPVDYYGLWLSRDAGRAIHGVIFRFVPTMVVGVLLFGVRAPPDAGRWLWFAISLMLAVWISFGLRFLYNLAAFWLLDYRGVGSLMAAITIFLSGFLVPLNFLPEWAQELVRWLPFAAMVQVPVEVLIGKRVGADLGVALAYQVTWALVFLAACRLVLARAERKLVVQGG